MFEQAFSFVVDQIKLVANLLFAWKLNFFGITLSYGALFISFGIMLIVISYFWRGGKK